MGFLPKSVFSHVSQLESKKQRCFFFASPLESFPPPGSIFSYNSIGVYEERVLEQTRDGRHPDRQ